MEPLTNASSVVSTVSNYLAPPYTGLDNACLNGAVVLEVLADGQRPVPALLRTPWPLDSGAWVEWPRARGTTGAESKYRLRVAAPRDTVAGHAAAMRVPIKAEWPMIVFLVHLVRGALEALVPERYAEMRNLLPPAQAARAAAVLLPGCFWYAVHRAHTAGEVPNECAGNPLDWWLSGGADRFAAVSAEGPAALPWPE